MTQPPLTGAAASFLLALLAALCLGAWGHSNGAPKNHKVCEALRPHHAGALPQTSASPYIVTTVKDKVPLNTPVEVTLTSTGNATAFKGFVMQARPAAYGGARPIGMFVIDDPTHSKPLNCYSMNDTVTHSSPIDKSSITFKWLPPGGYTGAVYFQAAFVQVFPIFWINVRKKVDIGKSGRADAKWFVPFPRYDLKMLEMERGMYEGCGSTKKCFGMPENCLPRRSCDAIVTIVRHGSKFVFELIGKKSNYVGVNLSERTDSSKRSVTECVLIHNRVKLSHSPKYSGEEMNSMQRISKSDTVLLNSSFVDGTIHCKFSIKTDSNGMFHDLKTTKYFLTLAIGNVKKDRLNSSIIFDNIKFKVSDTRMNLSDVKDERPMNKVNHEEESPGFGSFIKNLFHTFVQMV